MMLLPMMNFPFDEEQQNYADDHDDNNSLFKDVTSTLVVGLELANQQRMPLSSSSPANNEK